MSIAAKTKKVYKHIKKTMSIPAKTQNHQKKHEHSNENEKGVQTHQQTHEHSSKNEKTTALPEQPPEDILPFWAPALENTALSHARTASPRPLARTHNTNTKRNRNRFPDWGSTASIISPQSPIYIYIYIWPCVIMKLYGPRFTAHVSRGMKTRYEN